MSTTTPVTGDALHARLAAAADDDLFLPAEAGEIPGDPPVKVHKYGQAYRVNRADLFRRLGLDPAMVAVPVVPVPAQPPPADGDGWDALDGPIEEAAQ